MNPADPDLMRADPALPRSGQSAARIVAHRNVIGIKFSVFDGHM